MENNLEIKLKYLKIKREIHFWERAEKEWSTYLWKTAEKSDIKWHNADTRLTMGYTQPFGGVNAIKEKFPLFLLGGGETGNKGEIL